MHSHKLFSNAFVAVAATIAVAEEIVLKPKWKPSWSMKDSTIMMPCNYTGPLKTETYSGWGLVDFDWSNNKANWIKSRPMDDDQALFEQVQVGKKASPNTKFFIYRNSVYGYNWYGSVRKILDDPAYSAWFLKFKKGYKGRTCDWSDPPKCTEFWWSMEQSPYYPEGLHGAPGEPNPNSFINGLCSAPGCDCGKHPCGFYLFNISSDVKVKGQTFFDWYVNDYMLNEIGADESVSGFFWDDQWAPDCHMLDPDPTDSEKQCEQMGLTQWDLNQLSATYQTQMAALRKIIIDRQKFSWQMFWNDRHQTLNASDIGNTCPVPIISEQTCASDLRAMCREDAPPQKRAMMYALNPVRPTKWDGNTCVGFGKPADFQNDLANFLLIRCEYAWLGYGWLYPCLPHWYNRQDEMDLDPGLPLDKVCYETVPGESQVFVRRYTHANVTMDCNDWTGSVSWQLNSQDNKNDKNAKTVA